MKEGDPNSMILRRQIDQRNNIESSKLEPWNDQTMEKAQRQFNWERIAFATSADKITVY